MITQNPNSQEMYREQVESIFDQLPNIIWTNVAASSILFVFALVVGEDTSLLTYYWYGALLLITTLGFLGASRCRKLPESPASLKSKERLLMWISLLSGIAWGSTWVMAPFSAEPLLVAPRGATLIWPCALLASAAVSLPTIKKLFFSFAIPMTLFQLGFLIYQGSSRDLQLALGLAIALAFICYLALRINVSLNQSISLRIQNRNLGRELAEEEKILDQREAELLTRIKREEELLTEKKNTDNQLKMAAKEKLLLLDAIGEGIFGINDAGNITFVNAMALNLLNLQEEEVLGNNALELFCCSNAGTGKEAATRESLEACLQNGMPAQQVNGVFCGKNDLIIPVTFSCRPITEQGNTVGAVVSFFDISMQLEIEAKLLQSEKMETVGRIAGSVAHDFNNLLTVIIGNLQFLKRRIPNDENLTESKLIDKIMAASKSGADLNKRLLNFSREHALESAPENLNQVLVEMRAFLKRALGEEIRLELDLSDDESVVMIDRTQFENVIVNLCVNARDAMPDGGKVVLATRPIQITEPSTPSGAASGGSEYVLLTVTDFGTGIPQDIQDKIFDPLFTTKAVGKGTGFGLSTAFNFMQQSGGNITVQSHLDEGTTFALQIPIADKEKLAAQAQQSVPASDKQYSGTVLVVEDDMNVRDVATQMLLDAGFKVITAGTGHAGLEQFNKSSAIDLVFSDIVMPGGMSGVEMAEKIHASKPETPILLATGYTEKILTDRIQEFSNIICISKPYDTNELPRFINSMINKNSDDEDLGDL